MSCSIKWCGNSYRTSSYGTHGITFHRFPNIPELKEKWINAAHRENWFPKKSSVVCSRHFTSDCFVNLKHGRRLFSSATPTLFLPVLTLPDDSRNTQYQSSLLKDKNESSKSTMQPTSSKAPQLAAPITKLSISDIEVQVSVRLYLDQNMIRDYNSFPNEPSLKEKWIEATGNKDWYPTKHSTICSIHFDEGSFVEGKKQRILTKAAYPTIDVLKITTDEQDSAESENEIKVFCPKCDTEVSHTAEGMREDRIKILIAKVYHYFEQEYEELKTIYGDLDLTPLSKFRQRTALATGVSETTVLQILKEEERRNAEKREEPPEKRIESRKRSIQTERRIQNNEDYQVINADTSSGCIEQEKKATPQIENDNEDIIADNSSDDDSPDDNPDAHEQSSSFHEAQTLVVKVEPSEYYIEEPDIYVPTAAAVKVEPTDIEIKEEHAQTDPIFEDVKTEPSPRSDVWDSTIETFALFEPAATKRTGRKVPKRSDVTSTCTSETLALTDPAATTRQGGTIPGSDVISTRQHTQGESSTSSSSALSGETLIEELDKGSLFGGIEMKEEEIEIHEEGFS